MRRRWGATLRVVAAVTAVAGVSTGCGGLYGVPLPGGPDLGDHPFNVVVQFKDVLDLVPQSNVKVNDVNVGKVDKIGLAPDGVTAEVTVTLNGSVDLPANSLGSINQTSLLGEKYVTLAPPKDGATGKLADGLTIPLKDTTRGTELEEVFGALSLLLNGGGVAQLQTVARELNAALSGREGEVRSLVEETNTLVSGLNEQRSEISRALDGLNTLAKTVDTQKVNLQLALDDLPAGVKTLEEQRPQLVLLLKQARPAGRRRDLGDQSEQGRPGCRPTGVAADAARAGRLRLEPAQVLAAAVDLPVHGLLVDDPAERLRQPQPHCRLQLGNHHLQRGARPQAPRSTRSSVTESHADTGDGDAMRSKMVRVQLDVFLVITIVGVTYTAVRYVGLDRYFGASGYNVQMQLKNSGGIFPNAEVTYRGVAVGKVNQLRLTPTGVAVELNINDGAPEIPGDLQAAVANRSAVGEQYVDLRPNTAQGPFLKNGSSIPVDRTSIPVATEEPAGERGRPGAFRAAGLAEDRRP